MVLDGDDRVSLIHPGEAWVGLPWNDILTSIDSGEFDSVVAERDSQPSATPWAENWKKVVQANHSHR